MTPQARCSRRNHFPYFQSGTARLEICLRQQQRGDSEGAQVTACVAVAWWWPHRQFRSYAALPYAWLVALLILLTSVTDVLETRDSYAVSEGGLLLRPIRPSRTTIHQHRRSDGKLKSTCSAWIASHHAVGSCPQHTRAGRYWQSFRLSRLCPCYDLEVGSRREVPCVAGSCDGSVGFAAVQNFQHRCQASRVCTNAVAREVLATWLMFYIHIWALGRRSNWQGVSKT